MRNLVRSRALPLLRGLYDRIVRREFVWFDSDAQYRADIVYFYHMLAPTRSAHLENTKTIMIDLTRPQDELFGELGKNTRYKIKRAEREGVAFTASTQPTDAELSDFIAAHRDLEAREGRSPVDLATLTKIASNDRALVLTKAYDESGEPVSWHVYLRARGRVRLMHSVTMLVDRDTTRDKGFAGRANRLHHWRDICFFKEAGLEQFDFGGWVGPDGDPKHRSISEFKEGFGGAVVDCYNAVAPLTLLGRLTLGLRAGAGV